MIEAAVAATAVAIYSLYRVRKAHKSSNVSTAIKHSLDGIVKGNAHLSANRNPEAVSSFTATITTLQSWQTTAAIGFSRIFSARMFICSIIQSASAELGGSQAFVSQTSPNSVSDLLFEAFIGRSTARSNQSEWSKAVSDGERAHANASTIVQKISALNCLARAHAGYGEHAAAQRLQAEAASLRAAMETARVSEAARVERARQDAVREAAGGAAARRAAALSTATATYSEQVAAHIRARPDFCATDPMALWVPLSDIQAGCPPDPSALPGPLGTILRAAPAMLELDSSGLRVRLRHPASPHGP
jgi:hypothetical protein